MFDKIVEDEFQGEHEHYVDLLYAFTSLTLPIS